MVQTIADLPRPVTTMKADWELATSHLGFTPERDDKAARDSLLGTIGKQLGRGLVLEIVPLTREKPKDGSGLTTEERRIQRELGGRLIAVHQMLVRGFHIQDIMSPIAYAERQSRWADPEKPWRWSLGVPVLRSWDVVDRPEAKRVLGVERYQHHMGHASGILRPLDTADQAALASLQVTNRPTPVYEPAVLKVLREFGEYHTEHSDPDQDEKRTNLRDAQDDYVGKEGETVDERKLRVKRDAKIVALVKQSRPLRCAACTYDAHHRAAMIGQPAKARSLIHAHHKDWPLRGARETKQEDLLLLCPNCHAEVHAGRVLSSS